MRPARAAGADRSGLTCEHIMRLGRSGRWSWSEACYCTDKSRNPDASRPFANIVRCDDPAAMPPVIPGAISWSTDAPAAHSRPCARASRPSLNPPRRTGHDGCRAHSYQRSGFGFGGASPDALMRRPVSSSSIDSR